jgi:hypothetical protein
MSSSPKIVFFFKLMLDSPLVFGHLVRLSQDTVFWVTFRDDDDDDTERRERGRKDERRILREEKQRTIPTRELEYRKRKKYVDAVEKAQIYTEP